MKIRIIVFTPAYHVITIKHEETEGLHCFDTVTAWLLYFFESEFLFITIFSTAPVRLNFITPIRP